MKSSSTVKMKLGLAIVAVCVASAVVPTSSWQWYPTITVHVINGLKPGSLVLSLHCKSGDDDLGFQQLGVGQEFKWSFSKNIWGTTQFKCTFWWNGNLIERIVYDALLDQLNDTPQMYYKAAEQGLYESDNMRDWYPEPIPWGYSDWSPWTHKRPGH